MANTATESNTAQYAANHVSRTHPEWMLTVGTVKILNPGLAAVREHVTKVIMDIVERYADRVIAFYAGRIIADDTPAVALATVDVRRYVTGTLRPDAEPPRD